MLLPSRFVVAAIVIVILILTVHSWGIRIIIIIVIYIVIVVIIGLIDYSGVSSAKVTNKEAPPQRVAISFNLEPVK